jgi:hypothetical protein
VRGGRWEGVTYAGEVSQNNRQKRTNTEISESIICSRDKERGEGRVGERITDWKC